MRATISVALFSAAMNLLMLTGPLFMLQIYDRVLTSGSVPTLYALICIVGVLYAFMAVLEWIRARVLCRAARCWDEDLAPHLFRTVLSGDKALPPSAKVFSPLRDLDTVRNFLAGPGPLTLFDAPWIPIYIAVIFLLHPLLGWFAICAALILVVLAFANQWATKNRQADAAQFHEKSHAIAQEARSQSDFVRALALYDGLSGKWDELHDKGLSGQQSAVNRASFFSGITKSARLFFQAGILAIGAWLAIGQEISAGAIVAAAIILGRGLAPIEQLVAHWRALAAGLAAWKRLQLLTSVAPKTSIPKTSLPAPKGQLSANKLACFIPGLAEPVLSGVNFRLEPGDALGVVGPSGVGKTTLLKAILGIWPHVAGEVRLDGAELHQWERRALARHLGYVPQDTVLFSGTIAQNISRFLPDATSEHIVEAARLANVHELIVGLPLGYETVVGRGGVAVSAGQRQRIALACAFYGRPRLIVLDEPNANLDDEGNRALGLAIQSMRTSGSTILLATHRAAALANMDKMLVLRDGRQFSFGAQEQTGTMEPRRPFAVLSAKTKVRL